MEPQEPQNAPKRTKSPKTVQSVKFANAEAAREVRRKEMEVRKHKQEPLRRYDNPLISVDVHIPEDRPHVGPGDKWIKTVKRQIWMVHVDPGALHPESFFGI